MKENIAITINNLSKIYKNQKNYSLDNISLEIKSGIIFGLLGPNGAGKSTLINILADLVYKTSGTIKIDGQNISEINLTSLRREISIVDQNTTLFDDTVMNNIKYAKPEATDDEVFAAADLAMCKEFIDNLDEGYHTMIGENGVKLSGGEKQRLSIARAFLKKSKIILLDEATASLDSETEDKIQKALNELTNNKTTIVIAHRLSTILNSDNIYVVDNGKIIDSGNHENLLINSATYKNFYERQIKKQ